MVKSDLKKILNTLKNNVFIGKTLFSLVETLLDQYDHLNGTNYLYYFDGVVNDYLNIDDVLFSVNQLTKKLNN